MTPQAMREVLNSLQNPRVQAARRLRRRSFRSSEGAFLAEGPHIVREAIAAGAEVLEIFVAPELVTDPAVVSAEAGGVRAQVAGQQVIAALSDTATPQGIVAVVRAPAVRLEDALRGTDLVLVLAEVRDPGNAGTLVRSAVAAGAGAVVFGAGTVDAWSSKTIRASAGAVFHARMIAEAALPAAALTLRSGGFRIVGADAGAEQIYDAADLTGPVALVVGNEAWGVPKDAIGLLDEAVRIDMPGPVESLNAGIAGSLLLFEALRQRRGRRAYPLAP